MKLEQQLTSLNISKKLKELGITQDAYWAWIVDDEKTLNPPHWFIGDSTSYENSRYKDVYLVRNGSPKAERIKESYSAFSVAELGEILPKNIISFFRRDNDEWVCNLHYLSEYEDENGDYEHYGKQITDETEADARAKMLIYLIENGLIEKPINSQHVKTN